jgi:glucose/arabinose dehydrogenase/mono/diheme cytochrome c family protein
MATMAVCQGAPIHRWSFTGNGSAVAGTVLVDSVGSANGTVVGQGATFSGGALRLPGTTNGDVAPSAISAYVDLPNGLVSTRENASFEFWATLHSNRSFQRLFDFGRMTRSGMGTGAAAGEIRPDASGAPGGTSADDSMFLAVTRSSNATNTQQLTGRLNGTSTSVLSNATLTLGTQYHIVAVFEQGVGASAATGGRWSWYLNGNQTASTDLPFRLNQIEDVNVWLGRSQYSADLQANLSYNELRIYGRALTPEEIAANRAAGPDAFPAAPLALADSATMHPQQKVRVRVLDNDTGTIAPSTIEIVSPPSHGTAVPDPSGTILYTHTTGSPLSDTFTYRVAGPGGFSAPASVTITFGYQLRIPSGPLDVPQSPPTTTYSITDAFPISFNQPLDLASPPGDTRRLFVCERLGLLRVIADVTAASPVATTFLNLPSVLTSRGESLVTNSEAGLLSVAFHPNYATNRQFFIFYCVQRDGLTYNRVSRWTAQAGNPLLADTGSEQVLIEQHDEADNHNGGDMDFGPDGYLYISTGDEGGGNDQLDNSQTITRDFFSAILRIDPDKRSGNLAPNPHSAIIVSTPGNLTTARYLVPHDNPYVGATTFNGLSINASLVRTEFWAVGLRNPWRMSFDPATGELWTGDVGQNAREEINRITKGGNYGWAYREGTLNGPKSVPANATFTPTPPIYEYLRGSGPMEGISVTGGVWARNTGSALLEGAYIFADYHSGNIWALRMNGANAAVERIGGQAGIAGFGWDPSNNDVLAANINTGRIVRIGTADTLMSFPQTLSATHLFADLTDLSPSPGLLPYQINRPFWSDHALKRRWFVLPDPSAYFTWTEEGAWQSPAGAIWVKHFDLETVRGNASTAKRLETRLLVKNATGAFGVSYRWNEAGTEATLAPDAGVSFTVPVEENGVIANQTWTIPSRASCMTCHNQQAGFMLSFKTRQMNRNGVINGFDGNQISTLAFGGYFGNATPPPDTIPRHVRPSEFARPIGAHVRSYLEVNCGYCHMPGGTAPSNWDGRERTPLAAAGLLDGIPNNPGSDPLNRLVRSGDPERSVLLHRVAGTGGFTRMPAIATNELDEAAITMIRDWIQSSLPARKDYNTWRQEKFGSTTSPEGGQAEDPDGDRAINYDEFLADTLPTTGASFPQQFVDLDADRVFFSLEIPANRRVVVETSTDLINWQRWDVPGNNGLLAPEGILTFSGSLTDPHRFFRAILWED